MLTPQERRAYALAESAATGEPVNESVDGKPASLVYVCPRCAGAGLEQSAELYKGKSLMRIFDAGRERKPQWELAPASLGVVPCGICGATGLGGTNA